MSVVLEIPLAGGGSLLVKAEAADLPARFMLEEVASGGPAARLDRPWEQLTHDLGDVVRGLERALRPRAPGGEVAAEFGVRFGGPDGLLLVGSSEGVIKVTMTWAPAVTDLDAGRGGDAHE